MQIWPAIDLRGGKCVRLEQGDYARETIFGDDPLAVARRMVADGAQFLHLVDLDGARSGKVTHGEIVQSIARELPLECELGGGIRDEAAIDQALGWGLARVVIGTKALREPDWFRAMCRKHPGRLVLGIDAKDGRVATDGWLKPSAVDAVNLASQFSDEPLAAIIYTDIATDGMLQGPNVPAMQAMVDAVELPVIASGGVTTCDDIVHLREAGAAGCIIGRALYEDRLTLADALAAAEAKSNSPTLRVGR
jgi:phosphoribosylformimino-5-aminoimidazole carboxamide ribotide isomerase